MRFRFGYQLTGNDLADPIGVARRAEHLGFDVVAVADHVGRGLSPMVTLAAIATATSSVRLATMVLNNDMRNPVQLAWEAASLDRLSGGRFELGLGAGHSWPEYASTGVRFRPPAERKRRLMASVEVIRRLLDGETVTTTIGQDELVAARLEEGPVQRRLPILVGGNGAALLAHAGAHADVVGLQGLGATLADGRSHAVRWSASWVGEQVAQVVRGAAGRPSPPEISALVQIAEITDDTGPVVGRVLSRATGSSAADVAEIPYVLAGTVEEIAAKIVRCGERWGITYFVVRTLDPFAPVIAALRE